MLMRKYLFLGLLTFVLVGCSNDILLNKLDYNTTKVIGNKTQLIEPIEFKVNGVAFRMGKVESGTFSMGSMIASENASPVHKVSLSGYYIAETEVTEALWEVVMGENRFAGANSKLPVASVSWNDCQNFISKLNVLTGQTFSLPTEAQWEFAARGGVLSKLYMHAGGGNDEIDKLMWYWSNSHGCSHIVATKYPNELGLYDMNGNVNEWCSDWYHVYSESEVTNPIGPISATYRVMRGGSWLDENADCTVSNRMWALPDDSSIGTGLRLVLESYVE